MTTTASPNTNLSVIKPANVIDISRGAYLFGICPQVYLNLQLVTDYAELDPNLGQNAVGVILSVLSHHLATGRAGLGDDAITVCLQRREDGQLVEVDLAVRRRRNQGRECLIVSRAGERNMETPVFSSPGL
jgi:hypothetical protein